MELPLDVPKDPNYDSDRDEFLVKNSTLHSLIPLGSGRIVLKMTQPQTDPASRPDSAKSFKEASRSYKKFHGRNLYNIFVAIWEN